jgi:hypothetical protein
MRLVYILIQGLIFIFLVSNCSRKNDKNSLNFEEVFDSTKLNYLESKKIHFYISSKVTIENSKIFLSDSNCKYLLFDKNMKDSIMYPYSYTEPNYYDILVTRTINYSNDTIYTIEHSIHPNYGTFNLKNLKDTILYPSPIINQFIYIDSSGIVGFKSNYFTPPFSSRFPYVKRDFDYNECLKISVK